jgi:hypothetical protein
MEIGNFSVFVKDGILIVTSKKNVTLDDLKEVKTLMENSTGRGYSCGIYRDIIGYYDGYDFKNDVSIYCGTLNEKSSIEKIQNYKLTKNL